MVWLRAATRAINLDYITEIVLDGLTITLYRSPNDVQSSGPGLTEVVTFESAVNAQTAYNTVMNHLEPLAKIAGKISTYRADNLKPL